VYEDVSCDGAHSMVQQVKLVGSLPCSPGAPHRSTVSYPNSCFPQATSTSVRVPLAERQQNSTSTTSLPAGKRASGKNDALSSTNET